MQQTKRASDYDRELLDLYDKYVHGQVSRRSFLDSAAKFAVGGATAMSLLESLMPTDLAMNQRPAGWGGDPVPQPAHVPFSH